MKYEPQLPSTDRPFNLARFSREVVLSGILAVADDPAEMKTRIMQAWQNGHLSDAETRAWIVRHKLESA